MKAILVSILLLVSIGAYAQSEKIVYILYDSVEVTLKRQIDKIRKNNPRASFSCLLWRESDTLSSISLLKNEESSGNSVVKKLIAGSNRCLLVDKEKLPLIFDYDFKFSSSDLEHISSFGKREGNIRRSEFLFHGYTLSFNSRGEIIKIINY
jgi:hypothetical protein